MNWLEATAQLSQIAGVISVIFAAISIRSNTRLSQRQWNIDTFTTYSERHKAAIAAFPDSAFYNRLDPKKLPPRSPELTQAVLNYLFVICDVHYLAYQKTWTIPSGKPGAATLRVRSAVRSSLENGPISNLSLNSSSHSLNL